MPLEIRICSTYRGESRTGSLLAAASASAVDTAYLEAPARAFIHVFH